MSSMPALNPATLEEFRRQLHALKLDAADAVDARLHGRGEARHEEAGLPRHADETDDDASAETQRQADVVHLNRTATALQDIDAALVRLDAGEYGLCTECGEPIDIRRLRAHPAALRCAGCQQRLETQAGRAGVARP